MHFGYAETDITPAPGLELSGYGYFLQRRAQSTLDPLMARAVAFGEGDRRAVVVQLDLLALDAAFVAGVRRAVARRVGLPGDALLLHCTHTHSAPAVRRLFGCGEASAAFRHRLRGQVVALVERALSALRRPTETLCFGGEHIDGFAFNRTGGAPPDTELRGVCARFDDAPPLVLLGFACHPVALGPNRAYSADYCGAVVRACAARGLRAVFLNGCCGDVAPARQGVAPESLHAVGDTFAAAVLAGLAHASAWRPGPLRAGTRTVNLAAEAAPEPLPETGAEGPLAHVARLCGAHLQQLTRTRRLHTATAVEVQTLAMGEVLLVGLGAEVFGQLGAQLRAAFPAHHLLLAGTSNGVAGYVPNAADVEAGGYASTRGRRIYGLPGLSPRVGERFVAASAAAVKEVLSA
jgi:hypothetical protein